MNINDIEIKIKKWNKENNVVIVNILVLETIEIRGYTVRYTKTRFSTILPVWIVTPPSIPGRNKTWFHITRFKDTLLWENLQKKIIELVKEEYSTRV